MVPGEIAELVNLIQAEKIRVQFLLPSDILTQLKKSSKLMK